MKQTILLIVSVFIFSFAFSQKTDSLQLKQKFIDSLRTNTSIKQMDEFLWSNTSGKYYTEAKYIDMINTFVELKWQIWIQTKKK